MFGWRCIIAAQLLVASCLVTGTADAAAPEGTSRSAARALGLAGIKDYENGRYAEALDKLEKVLAVVPAPGPGLWSARAMVKLGKFVEAAERYLEVTRLDVTTGDAAVQKRSQLEAAAERAALLPRIPILTVVVQGRPISEVRLVLDGKELPGELVGTDLPVNPGVHRVVAQVDGTNIEQEATVEEGERANVELKLPNSEVAPSAPQPVALATKESNPAVPTGRAQKTAGWIVLTLGGVGLAVGGIAGGLAVGKKADLEGHCINGGCDPTYRDQVDSYTTLRSASTIGFIAGGIGVGAGLALLFTARSTNTHDAPRTGTNVSLSPWVGLGSTGVAGRF